MGDRGHNRQGRKERELLCLFRGGAESPSNVAWVNVYFRTKWRLHPPSPLATIDMVKKLGAVPL